MKLRILTNALMALSATMLSHQAVAQNVGIGTSIPLDKLHVVGNIRSTTLAGVGNRLVLADPNGTLMAGGMAGSPAWLVTGNSGLTGGTTSSAGANFLGTTDAVNVDFRTSNLYRGRISALGEFFWGTFNTTIAGDFLNVVCNNTFYWGVNGYSPPGANGGAIYGQIQPGNTTIFGAVQGEYFGTSASGAGVRGIAGTGTAIGVHGQEPTLGGWALLASGDIGAILPGNYYTISDQRLKKNILPIDGALG